MENEDEICVSRLEEWKRWFWEGVDEDQFDNEEKVEFFEDMLEELCQLGGVSILIICVWYGVLMDNMIFLIGIF